MQDPGTPDHRSPARYLLWAARTQVRTMAAGASFAVVWMVAQALMPATIGRAIDAGVTARDPRALGLWTGVLLALGVIQAATGIMRHRNSVVNWLGAAFRTIQLTARQAVRLGATLPRRVATGEVVSVGIADVVNIGDAMDICARGTGSVVSIIVVAVILLTTSLPLGLMVLVGVPVMAAVVGPLLRPLHRRQERQRELQGELATRATDIVAGLRVLRGIGGERVFADRYREESQAVRGAGVRVARTDALLEGAQVLLPGLLVALVTWIGARFALNGEITIGQLVSFYGYAVFLVEPLRTLTEAADKITKGLVAARRVVRILEITPDLADEGTASPARGDLVDAASGLRVRGGRLTAVAATAPEDAAAIADRLGRFADGDVTWGGVPLGDLPLPTVRATVLVADNDATLFSGPLLAELLGRHGAAPYSGPLPDEPLRGDGAAPFAGRPQGALGTVGAAVVDGAAAAVPYAANGGSGDQGAERVRAALWAACADDILAELPDGLDSELSERGREFSGGQQQRLRLVRALAADPETLILVEPTSAVDAHTEARIAERLAAFRDGRTTVVCSTSPLVLDHADEVAFVADGRVVATGPHRTLLATEPRYAATVTRGGGEET